jgi:hypothetical protein
MVDNYDSDDEENGDKMSPEMMEAALMDAVKAGDY